MRRGGPLCSSGALTWSDSSPPPKLSNGAPRPPRTEPQGPTEGQRRAAGSAPSLLGVFHWTDRAQLVNPFLGGSRVATFRFSTAVCSSAWPSVTRRAECQHRPTPILHASQPLSQPSSPTLRRHASVPCVKPGGTGPRSLGTNWKEGRAASYPAPAKLLLTAVSAARRGTELQL